MDGEILHTTLGFRLFWMKDAALQRACFSVYNDWLAEFSSTRQTGWGESLSSHCTTLTWRARSYDTPHPSAFVAG